MPRNRYETARGVLALNWRQGSHPATYAGPVLVEVWREWTNFGCGEHDVPDVTVCAQFEVRVMVDGAWKRLDYRGQLVVPRPGDIRRWAVLDLHRWWTAAITIDGWQARSFE